MIFFSNLIIFFRLRRLGHKLDEIKKMLKERTGESLSCKDMVKCSKKKTAENQYQQYMEYYFDDEADQNWDSLTICSHL